jgi:NAD(P)H-flavin reductase
MCVRAVGNVTKAMRTLGKGDLIGIRGPFGHGFPVEAFEGKDVLFVAGGLGIIPLRSLIQYVMDQRDAFGNVKILYGAKNPGELLYPEETAAWADLADVDFHVTVDRPDGNWKGNVGVITTLFRHVEIDPEKTVAAVVGPPVMYKFVVGELFVLGIPARDIWMSLERRMKCGVGKCGHCQINGKFCCQDGPVFNYAEMQHLREGI